MRLEGTFISIKKEGGLSSFNRSYDKEVAKTDKRVQYQILAYLCQLKRSNNFIDQWIRILVGCASVRYTRDHPTIWINYFRAVNLHPRYMLPFKDWCKKIEHHMHESDSFDLLTKSKVDEYQPINVLWQSMVTDEKFKALSVFNSHECMWTPSCVMDLKNNFHLTLKEVASLQVFIWIDLDHPRHLDRGTEDVEIALPSVVAAAEK